MDESSPSRAPESRPRRRVIDNPQTAQPEAQSPFRESESVLATPPKPVENKMR